MFPSLKKFNMDKIAKQLIAMAIKSSEEDAKLYERRAESARMMAEVMRQLAPVVKEVMHPKPFKPPKMTKKQKAAMKRAMKNYPHLAGQPVMVGAPIRPS